MLHNQGVLPAQTARLQPFPTTNHTTPSLQWSRTNKHTAAGWDFIPKWQMPLWQTVRGTFTWNLCLLPLIKNVESRIELPLSDRPGVFSFCPGWKSFHIPFLRGQRSASALPARPPATAPACWVTGINPFAACSSRTEQHGSKVFRGFIRFFVGLMPRCGAEPGRILRNPCSTEQDAAATGAALLNYMNTLNIESEFTVRSLGDNSRTRGGGGGCWTCCANIWTQT